MRRKFRLPPMPKDEPAPAAPIGEGPKYPAIKVRLVGNDGNAFAILANVAGALKKANVPHDEVAKFYQEATAGNYDHLLATCMKWVDVS